MPSLFRCSALVAVISTAILPATASAATGEDGWDWSIAPYLWAPTISVDLNRNTPPFGSETRFNDLVSKIDMAALVHVDGQGERFGVLADLVFLSLGDGATRTVYSSDSSLDATVAEVAGVWNVEPARYQGLDLFAGVRYFDVELDVDLDPVDPAFPSAQLGADASYTDFMVGARYHARLSDRWGMTLRGDGSWGDTDGSVGAVVLFNYRVKWGAWQAGYRYLAVELPTAGQRVDLDLSGPVIAFAFDL